MSWAANWWPKGAAGRELLELLIFSRIGLVLAGWVGLARLSWKYYSPTYNVSSNPLILMWTRWDAMWYTGIAIHGYWFQALAFFPLYPLLIAGLHWITFVPYPVAAIVVSNLALVGYTVVFYRLVYESFDGELAIRAVWMALMFPTAFFLSAAYTESLFLFLSVSAVLAARRRRFVWSAIWIMLGTLTRNEGVFLVIPWIWAYYQQYGLRWSKALWAGLIIPSGVLAFMGYQWADFGSPIAFIQAQSYWGRHITWPWVGIILALQQILKGSPLQPSAVLSMIDLSAALASMVLWWVGWRNRLPWDWLAYWGMLLVIDVSAPDPTGRSPLLSMSRLVLILFPSYVVMGQLVKNPSWQRGFQWVLPALQVTFFLVFATWHWIA